MKLLIIRGPAGLDIKPWLIANLPYAREVTDASKCLRGHIEQNPSTLEVQHVNYYLRIERPELWWLYPFITKFEAQGEVRLLDLIISPEALANLRRIPLNVALREVQAYLDNPIPAEWNIPVETHRMSLGGWTPRQQTLPDNATEQLLKLRETLTKCCTVPQEAKHLMLRTLDGVLNVK